METAWAGRSRGACSCLLRIRTPASPLPSVQSSSSDPHPPPASEDSRVRDGPGGGRAGAGRPARKAASRGAGSADCVFSVSISLLSCPVRLRSRLLPSGWGSFLVLRSQSTQCAGPSPSDSSRIRGVAAPPRLPTEPQAVRSWQCLRSLLL